LKHAKSEHLVLKSILKPSLQKLDLEKADLIVTIGNDDCGSYFNLPQLCLAVTKEFEKPSLKLEDSVTLLKNYELLFGRKPVIYVSLKENEKNFNTHFSTTHWLKPLWIDSRVVSSVNSTLLQEELERLMPAYGIIMARDDLLMDQVSILIKAAQKHNIPLGVMDQGSVSEGASFSYSPSSDLIGQKGAQLALKMLNSASENNNEPIYLNTKKIFYNQSLKASKNGNMLELVQYAKQHGVALIELQTLARPNL